ncbi:MAG: class I SAM-dependent methyltransferase [Thermoplasmata archaeon]|nr:class I SAM-dependent methyltransferase [Thermoplasmata archaeon]
MTELTAGRATMRWPPPLPGRPEWSWLLGLRFRRWRIRSLLRLLERRLPPSARVLDVGSGPGFSSAELARTLGADARRWTLVDPQRAMLSTPRGRRALARSAPGASSIVGDAAALPIRSGSVDVVLSLGVLCCMEDSAVPAAVEETVRVLKPGGFLLFGVPRRRGPSDDARWRSVGLAPVATLRPGRGLFQKTL